MNKILFASLIAVAAGCQNPKYCAGKNADNNCDEPGDGGNGSDGSGSNVTDCVADMSLCEGVTPVCDTTSKTCVECEVATQCTSATAPACSADHTCEACVTPNDCGGADGTCMADGSCANKADVAWVMSTGADTNDCSHDNPCLTIGKALGTSKSIVHVVGTRDEAITAPADLTKTIVGERDATGAIITTLKSSTASTYVASVLGTATKLVLENVAIQSSVTNTTMSALYLFSAATTPELDLLKSTVDGGGVTAGFGVVATNGKVVVDQSSITNFKKGGLSFSSSTFKVTNTFITDNGGSGANGGVYLTNSASGTIDFSTIANNIGPNGTPMGINNSGSTCTVTSSNIANNSPLQTNQTTFTFSNVYPNDSSVPMTNGNIAVAPGFLSATDYHLATSSMLIDKADTAATLKIDFDGNKRPMGVNRDIGADEAN